jgi:hypothetical protein
LIIKTFVVWQKQNAHFPEKKVSRMLADIKKMPTFATAIEKQRLQMRK